MDQRLSLGRRDAVVGVDLERMVFLHMSRRPWFKCFPSDFLNGVSEMTPHELAVYTICLMRMYDEDGAIADEPARIARRCNMRLPTCIKSVDSLSGRGKLTIIDGTLINGSEDNALVMLPLSCKQPPISTHKL